MAVYDINGTWEIRVSNPDPYLYRITINQQGQHFTGNYEIIFMGKGNGTLEGIINGNQIIFDFDNKDEFSGTFNLNGRLTGIVINAAEPEHSGVDAWASLQTFKQV